MRTELGWGPHRGGAVGRGEPVTVLLVEDDEADAYLVRDALAEAAPSMTVRHVGTLAEAEAAISGGIGCAVLDLGLPDTTGLEGVRRLREIAPDVSIVVLTGRDDEQLGIEAVGAGAQDYLVKGQVEPEVLARALRYAMERRRAERSEQELLEARLQASENARLERGLLPTALIRDPRLRLASGYRPGRRRALLGGDFFDTVELEDGSVHAMIGDVCGHGADEAALGACLRIAWRALTLAQRPPEEVIATLHEMLPHESHATEMFATLCSLEIRPDRRAATVWLAGHPPPILLDAAGARAVEVTAASPPLGLFEQRERPGTEVELGDAWSLLLYTDGLVEGRVGDGPVRLGDERLVEMLGRRAVASPGWEADAGALLDGLIAEVEELNGEPLTDDLAVLLLSSTRG